MKSSQKKTISLILYSSSFIPPRKEVKPVKHVFFEPPLGAKPTEAAAPTDCALALAESGLLHVALRGAFAQALGTGALAGDGRTGAGCERMKQKAKGIFPLNMSRVFFKGFGCLKDVLLKPFYIFDCEEQGGVREEGFRRSAWEIQKPTHATSYPTSDSPQAPGKVPGLVRLLRAFFAKAGSGNPPGV